MDRKKRKKKKQRAKHKVWNQLNKSWCISENLGWSISITYWDNFILIMLATITNKNMKKLSGKMGFAKALFIAQLRTIPSLEIFSEFLFLFFWKIEHLFQKQFFSLCKNIPVTIELQKFFETRFFWKFFWGHEGTWVGVGQEFD